MIVPVDYGFEQRDIEPVARLVMEWLGLDDSGGMVRVGPVHYNTVEELKQFGEALGRTADGKKNTLGYAGTR